MSKDGPDVGGDERREVGDLSPAARRPAATDDLDAVFDLLSDARRRYVLYYLLGMSGSVAELEAVVDGVASYEAAGTDADEEPTRKRVRISLHHVHLPVLASEGVVDYDPRQGTVRFAGDATLEAWVERARREELD